MFTDARVAAVVAQDDQRGWYLANFHRHLHRAFTLRNNSHL
jgi:hypothetical protein